MIRTIAATAGLGRVTVTALCALLACVLAAFASSVASGADPTDQRCFGAASRAPGAPCVNITLNTMVVPTPAAAQTVPDADCGVVHRSRALFVCGWGVPADRSVRTVALIGDSHAAHWRPALELVAARENWRVVSMSRAGCPLTTAHPKLPTKARSASCVAWNRSVQRWLARHRTVSVVFVAQHRINVSVPKGHLQTPVIRRGYTSAWRQLLGGHVQHVVVLRDTPRDTPNTQACVTGAIAGGIAAGPACAVPRRYALPPDPARAAARAIHNPRVQVVDLSRVFCGPRFCLPVIGGALVHRDTEHMTREFVVSLGPILLDAVDVLMRAWHDPVRRASGYGNVTASPAVDPKKGPVSPLQPRGPATTP